MKIQNSCIQSVDDLTKEVIRLTELVNKMCALQIIMIKAMSKILEVEAEYDQ